MVLSFVLDENLNPKSPPNPGGRAHAHLEARAAASCRTPALSRLRPASITMRSMRRSKLCKKGV
jgi:hypothetical protein